MTFAEVEAAERMLTLSVNVKVVDAAETGPVELIKAIVVRARNVFFT